MKFLAILLLTITAMSVIADPGKTYLSASYHLGTYDEAGFPAVKPPGLKIKGGKYIANNIAIEGHLIFGVGTDTILLELDDGTSVFEFDIDIKLKQAASAFIKADLPLSSAVNLYGLLGLTKVKIEASALGITASDDDSGLSYGLGSDVNLGNDIYILAEYVFYLSESDYDYTGFNIGISKVF